MRGGVEYSHFIYLIVHKTMNILNIAKLATFGLGVTLVPLALTINNSAQAAVFTFGAGDNNQSTITKTVDGITLTLSNNQTLGYFHADGDGVSVLVGGAFLGATTTSFNLTFSSAVQLTSYTIGYIDQLEGDESFTLSNGSSSSVETSPFSAGLRNFSNQFTVAAGQTVSFTGNLGTNLEDLIQWSALEVTPVSPPPATTPEPSTILGLLAVGSLGALSRKLQG
ncbi:MAG: PEP-CTERM sorting domain-containing protein [Microcystis sp. M_OC_Ca_00000000_S217Cul]|nr:MAG: PEP-CTERM sorting domain-containing protein [Microcystis sp. M_OC_Ca_00000000_S217Cul]TRT93963.1 MAG: PEP-CTERM sorting domain-containing protein [Microcystis sp. M_OC_Ca_00000000_C217Col]